MEPVPAPSSLHTNTHSFSLSSIVLCWDTDPLSESHDYANNCLPESACQVSLTLVASSEEDRLEFGFFRWKKDANSQAFVIEETTRNTWMPSTFVRAEVKNEGTSRVACASIPASRAPFPDAFDAGRVRGVVVASRGCHHIPLLQARTRKADPVRRLSTSSQYLMRHLLQLPSH